MPTVPGNVAQARSDIDIPDQTFLLMAAATMHEMGRLVAPFQVAGDVLPLPMTGAANTGPTNRSADYAVGKAKDPKIEALPIDTLKSWMDRTSSRQR